MKMKKADFGVVIFMYAVCAFFYVYSNDLEKGSRTYPLFTIALLFFLTTLYLAQMVIAARKFGTESGFRELFDGFKPGQFLVAAALTVVYYFLMKYVGFFSATTVFMLACLLYLKVPLPHTAIAVVVMNLLIYLAFVKFLGVRLPAGLLF